MRALLSWLFFCADRTAPWPRPRKCWSGKTRSISPNPKPRKAAWMTAEAGLQLAANDRLRTGQLSRALVQFTSRAMLRLNELTSLTLTPSERGAAGPGLDLLGGTAYFLSRERPEEIRLRTPSANGILRGTEFHLAVRGDTTTLVMFEGEVDIGNAAAASPRAAASRSKSRRGARRGRRRSSRRGTSSSGASTTPASCNPTNCRWPARSKTRWQIPVPPPRARVSRAA